MYIGMCNTTKHFFLLICYQLQLDTIEEIVYIDLSPVMCKFLGEIKDTLASW